MRIPGIQQEYGWKLEKSVFKCTITHSTYSHVINYSMSPFDQSLLNMIVGKLQM